RRRHRAHPRRRADGLPRPRAGTAGRRPPGAHAHALGLLARPWAARRFRARERGVRGRARTPRGVAVPGWKIPLSDLQLGAEERAAVDRVVDSGWLTLGNEVAEFEREFAASCGAEGAVAVANGTAALHLACLALGVGPGV